MSSFIISNMFLKKFIKVGKQEEKGLDIRTIQVPDLKQYIVNGYEEIREVKAANIELQKQIDEEKKYKMLYENALVTVDEFNKIKEDDKKEIERLKIILNKNDKKIYELNSELNNYKIAEREFTKKARKEAVKTIEDKIIETKGNLSKEKVLRIIRDII